MLEFTPQELNIPASILSQVEKFGAAKLLGENGHNFYIYPEEKKDTDIGLRFNSAEELREYAMKQTGQTWEEIEQSAKQVED